MSSPRSGRSNGGRSGNESPVLLLVAVAIVSFFAGTVLTAHVHLGSCLMGNDVNLLSNNKDSDGGSGGHHQLNAKVEELAQKRLLGPSASSVILQLCTSPVVFSFGFSSCEIYFSDGTLTFFAYLLRLSAQ